MNLNCSQLILYNFKLINIIFSIKKFINTKIHLNFVMYTWIDLKTITNDKNQNIIFLRLKVKKLFYTNTNKILKFNISYKISLILKFRI